MSENMPNLDKLRKDIDILDKELVSLFEKRMDIVKAVARWKLANRQQVFDSSRENKVIQKAVASLKDKKLSKYLGQFFEAMFQVSRIAQADILRTYSDNDNEIIEAVGYQGVQGSYSEQALVDYFGANSMKKNYSSFEDVFEALKNNEILYGVLPIENSSAGSVSRVVDLLREYDFYIVGEQIIKVEHNLLVLPGTKIGEINKVYSHPQALEQSKVFLESINDWELVPYSNTAESAKLVAESEDKTIAAVASKRAGELYALEILESAINYNTDNNTRFVIIGKDMQANEDDNKVSLALSTSHKPGALFDILSHFNKNNINLLKLESRPLIDKSWEYFFYIDFEGNILDKKVDEILKVLPEYSSYFKLLGC